MMPRTSTIKFAELSKSKSVLIALRNQIVLFPDDNRSVF